MLDLIKGFRLYSIR